VQSLRSQVVAIARTLEIGAVGGVLPKIRDSKALERYVGEPFLYVSVVDAADGRGPAAGFTLQEPSIVQGLEAAFVSGRQGKPTFSPAIVSATFQEPVSVLSEPVYADKGAPAQRVVVAVATLLPVWSMTARMGQDKIYEVYVVDTQGRLVAHIRPHPQARHRPLLDRDREAVHEVDGHGRFPQADHVLRARHRSRLDQDARHLLAGSRYALGSHRPGRAGQGLRGRHPDAEGVGDPGWGWWTLLAAILGTLFAGQISRPIQQLAEGARRLAGGGLRDPGEGQERERGGRARRRLQPDGGRDREVIEEIRQAAATNKELFMGSIRMLANAIDEKDPYTRGHSERVAYYSMITARYLGMPEEEVERVHLSGILHDVGKIGIEDKILRKAAALTDDEYEIMKQHPTKGAHILAAVPMLQEMAGAGLQHHENWDGTGYPDGLKGEEIPLLGRIVSVADAFDAMTTDRPYSKAMTHEGVDRPPAVPDRQEVRRHLRRGLREGRGRGRADSGQGPPGRGGGPPAGGGGRGAGEPSPRRAHPRPHDVTLATRGEWSA
jgi:hypothetical protein